MKRARDDLLAAARSLERALARRQPAGVRSHLHQDLEHLLACQWGLLKLDRLLLHAEHRQWLSAADCVADRIFQTAMSVRDAAIALLARQRELFEPPPQPPVTLRLLLEELRQLARELGPVEVDKRRAAVAITTEPIVLCGTDLGPFRIELVIGRLSGGRADSAAFNCVALEPTPAGDDSSVTHPHVRDDVLCAGEASAAIQQALRSGRIADAFFLVKAVLANYNPASAYVSLEDWEGLACGDCGQRCSREWMLQCQACTHFYCEDCMSLCDGCQESVCGGCLEREARTRRQLCGRCRSECQNCGGILGDNTLNKTGFPRRATHST